MGDEGVPTLSLKRTCSVLSDGEQEQALEAFARFDTNGNGVIEFEELLASLGELKAGGFSSPEVLKEYIVDLFKRADRDESGAIDQDEFLAVYNELQLADPAMTDMLETPRHEIKSVKSGPTIASASREDIQRAEAEASKVATDDWNLGWHDDEGNEDLPSWHVTIGSTPKFGSQGCENEEAYMLNDDDWEPPYLECALSHSESTKLVSFVFEQDLMSRDSPATWMYEVYCPASQAFTGYMFEAP